MSYTRSELFALVLGFTGIAQAKDVTIAGTSEADNVFLGKAKLQNGQCPVCGELASRYVRQTFAETGKCESVPGSSTAVRCIVTEKPYGEDKRLIECSRCSAAFFQRAEKIEE